MITRDERLRGENMGHYLRAATDNRNLYCDKFVVKGEANESRASHNTNYLDVQGTIKKIMMTVYGEQQLAGNQWLRKGGVLLKNWIFVD